MSGLFAGAMTIVMALVLFVSVIPLGGVNPVLAAPYLAFVVVLLLLWSVRIFMGDRLPWANSPMNLPISAFIIYATFRSLSSPYAYETRNELLQVFVCGLVYFGASSCFGSRGDRTLLLGTLLTLVVFQSGYGMWQAFTYSDSIFHWGRPELYNGRGSGSFVCPNHLAGFLEMALGLLAARAMILRRESQSIERSAILKILTIYGVIMATLGIAISLSRAGWVATCIGMSALLVLAGWRFRLTITRVVLAFLLIAFVGLFLWSVEPLRNYFIKSVKVDDQTSQISLGDPTMGGRTSMWRGTLELIRERPLLGSGIGSWQWVYQKHKDHRILSFPEYAHNDYLNLASDYGLIGFAIVVAVFISFFMHAWRAVKSARTSEARAFAIGAMVAVISILVHSFFDFNLHIPANSLFLALIMGYTAAISARKDEEALKPLGPVLRCAISLGILALLGLGISFFVPTALAFHHSTLGHNAKADLDFDTAHQHFGRAAELDPTFPKPHIESGDIYRDQAAWRIGPGKQAERRMLAQKAVEAYGRALELNPSRSDVWVSKARAHEFLGEDEAILLCLQKAIEVAPVNPYAHFELGRYYRDRGDDAKAGEAFLRADKYFLHNDPMFQVNSYETGEQLKKGKKQ